jgi:UDP-4-amino-4,6-dideoxy-N-acetyl-beta-L-altrosamine N-acetyltransferase
MPLRTDYKLRPVEERDLDLVLSWRNSERVRRTMYADHIISVAEHRAWFERLQSSDRLQYLIFEHKGRPVGMVKIDDINRTNRTCYWGFYIGEEDTPKGTGSAMGFLALEHVFGTLGMGRVIGEVLAFNEGSIKFHRRLGFVEEGRFAGHVMRQGVCEDVVSFVLVDSVWQALRPQLEQKFFERQGERCGK